jgi:hypothetical protein
MADLVNFAEKSDQEIDTWISNHEIRKQTDSPLYRALLEERARRSSNHLNVDRTLDYLRDYAKKQKFTTYGQVAEANGMDWKNARRHMPRHLDRGLEVCHARGWPLLTAICVKQNEVETGELSGDSLAGFIKGVRRLGYSVTDEKQFLKDAQKACFEWSI